MDKPKVVIDYQKLSPELMELFSETFPQGIVGQTIRFPNAKGEIITAVRMETEDRIYLVKLSARAREILSDEDLDDLIRSNATEDSSSDSMSEDVDDSDEED